MFISNILTSSFFSIALCFGLSSRSNDEHLDLQSRLKNNVSGLNKPLPFSNPLSNSKPERKAGLGDASAQLSNLSPCDPAARYYVQNWGLERLCLPLLIKANDKLSIGNSGDMPGTAYGAAVKVLQEMFDFKDESGAFPLRSVIALAAIEIDMIQQIKLNSKNRDSEQESVVEKFKTRVEEVDFGLEKKFSTTSEFTGLLTILRGSVSRSSTLRVGQKNGNLWDYSELFKPLTTREKAIAGTGFVCCIAVFWKTYRHFK
jgi:hypothetical protein